MIREQNNLILLSLCEFPIHERCVRALRKQIEVLFNVALITDLNTVLKQEELLTELQTLLYILLQKNDILPIPLNALLVYAFACHSFNEHF